MLIGSSVVTKKEISIKINLNDNNKRSWLMVITGLSRQRTGFDSQREQEFFLFRFLI